MYQRGKFVGKKKKKMKHGRTIQFGLIQQAFFEAS